MIRLLTAALLLVALTAGAQPAFHVQQASFTAGDADRPALACSPDGWTMLAFQAGEEAQPTTLVHAQLLPTLADDTPEDLPPPVLLNSGSRPAVCWTREGFVLACISGDAVLAFRSDPAGVWDPVPAVLIPGGAVLGLDLAGEPDPGNGAFAALVVETSLSPPSGDFRAQYAELSDAGWSGFETVAESHSWRMNAQVTVVNAGTGLQPTVWFVQGTLEPTLRRRTRASTGWLAPEFLPPVPTAIVGEFAVAASDDASVDVLGLGMQPTCPCGSIFHKHADAWSDWDPALWMNEDHGYYDWPMSPNIAVAANGRVHAFWSQLASDMEMHPHQRDLEYHVLENGIWTDAGEVLDAQPKRRLGSLVAMDVAPADDPVLAWTRRDTLGGVPQPQRIWVARRLDLSDVPAADGLLALSANPNPFNPRTELILAGLPAGPAVVEICDARGRVVRRLRGTADPTGALVLTWQGRDDAGREMPGGLYLARTVVGSASVRCKLTLLR